MIVSDEHFLLPCFYRNGGISECLLASIALPLANGKEWMAHRKVLWWCSIQFFFSLFVQRNHAYIHFWKNIMSNNLKRKKKISSNDTEFCRTRNKVRIFIIVAGWSTVAYTLGATIEKFWSFSKKYRLNLCNVMCIWFKVGVSYTEYVGKTAWQRVLPQE